MTTPKKKVKKEAWDAMQGITNLKGGWYEAVSKGLDPTQYHKDAAPLYAYLYDNGHGDIADAFNAADYSGALSILDQYESENLYDEYFNSVNSAPSRQNTAGLDPTSSQWQGQAKDFLEASKNPQISDTAQKMYDSYHQLENILNGPITKDENGNVVSGLNVDHYNSGKGQLDYLQNFDVTKQPYYEGIMAQYKLLGGDAAQGELAGGAAGNSGNIDSFAQANANRQQLAFTTAGINQALAAANQNQQNWQNVYDRMTAHLNNIGVLNNGKLVEAGKVYETDSVERQNALNQAAGLAQQEMENNMKWYLDMLGYDKTMDALNKEVAAGLYGVNVDADTQKYGYDTALKQTETQAEADKYGYWASLEGTKYASDNELKGILEQARIQGISYEKALEGTKYESDNNLKGILAQVEGTKYVSDNDYKTATLSGTDLAEYTNAEWTEALYESVIDGQRNDITTWEMFEAVLSEYIGASAAKTYTNALKKEKGFDEDAPFPSLAIKPDNASLGR